MDHQLIEDTALPERYVTGHLEGQELALFEEHLVDCPICLERVESSEGFAAGLKATSAPPKIPASARHPKRRWSQRSTWLVATACAAGLLAVVLTTARFGRLAQELVVERTAGVEARAQLNAAQTQLARERTAREAAEARLAAQPTPAPVRIPVLALLATRGATSPALELSAGPEPFLLLVERESPPRFQSYVVTLRSSQGAVVWQGRALPSSRDALAVALDSGHFAPGTYSLTLEGESVGGRLVRVAQYTFHTVTTAGHMVTPVSDAPR